MPIDPEKRLLWRILTEEESNKSPHPEPTTLLARPDAKATPFFYPGLPHIWRRPWGEGEDCLREKTEKGALLMTDIPFSQTFENGVVADIAGYVPAAAVVARGKRQEARYKLRSSLRQVTSLKRLRYCGLPFDNDMVVRRKDGVHHFAGLRRKQDEVRHFSGLSTCGSGWVCGVACVCGAGCVCAVG